MLPISFLPHNTEAVTRNNVNIRIDHLLQHVKLAEFASLSKRVSTIERDIGLKECVELEEKADEVKELKQIVTSLSKQIVKLESVLAALLATQT